MSLQVEQEVTAILILPNILKSKGSGTVKFGQLIECNLRNTFLQK